MRILIGFYNRADGNKTWHVSFVHAQGPGPGKVACGWGKSWTTRGSKINWTETKEGSGREVSAYFWEQGERSFERACRSCAAEIDSRIDAVERLAEVAEGQR